MSTGRRKANWKVPSLSQKRVRLEKKKKQQKNHIGQNLISNLDNNFWIPSAAKLSHSYSMRLKSGEEQLQDKKILPRITQCLFSKVSTKIILFSFCSNCSNTNQRWAKRDVFLCPEANQRASSSITGFWTIMPLSLALFPYYFSSPMKLDNSAFLFRHFLVLWQIKKGNHTDLGEKTDSFSVHHEYYHISIWFCSSVL